VSDSISTLDDEVDDWPPDDSRETCWFWEPVKARCHYEPIVIGLGGPCADCPEEDDRIGTLPNSTE
jgi:hypothetical protein